MIDILRSALLWARTLPLLAVATATVGCHSGSQQLPVPPDQAQQLLLDRNWLDRLPETPRDRLHVFRFVPSMGGGVYQDRTLYAGQFELFNFSHDGQSVLFRLHHTGEELRSSYFIERVPPELGSHFDLHLHLNSTPRGPSDYYNIKDSSADPRDPEDQLRRLFTHDAR